MTSPCVIEVALNGATTTATNPHVPRRPAEITADALACIDAGAAIVHNHNDERSRSRTMCTPRIFDPRSGSRTMRGRRRRRTSTGRWRGSSRSAVGAWRARLVEECGRSVATAAEAHEILGLEPRG
jgi:uncharacterized protein (DUF849 family)